MIVLKNTKTCECNLAGLVERVGIEPTRVLTVLDLKPLACALRAGVRSYGPAPRYFWRRVFSTPKHYPRPPRRQ